MIKAVEVPSDLTLCGSCAVAWDLICKKVGSQTQLFVWLELCHRGCCDPTLWDYLADNGDINWDVPPPEYVPGLPRTDMHRTNRPGPYRAEKVVRARKQRETVPPAPADDGEWVTDW